MNNLEKNLKIVFMGTPDFAVGALEALIREGYIREVTSKIQTMRKEAGFVVTDHIHVYVTGAETVCGLLESDAAEVCTAVLAVSMQTTAAAQGVGYTKDWDINGENVTITVVKA